MRTQGARSASKRTGSYGNLSGFSLYLWLTLGMFVVFAATFVIYVQSEKQLDRANAARLQSYLLADELRQSSDDLTRMVRSYVVTGNPLYKQRYQEILDIRDGRKPRPVRYEDIYWDLVLADDRRPRSMGPPVPLLELMRQAGFTDGEFAKLAEAKANSDALTRAEFSAMELVEATSAPTQANRTAAVLMLFDAGYHEAKARIMRPISEFHQSANQRTLAAVQDAEAHAARIRIAFIVFGLLLMSMLWGARRHLRAALGCPVDELYARIAELGSGDFAAPVPVAKGMEDSVLGWLSETQINLARLDAQRSQRTAELAQANEALHLENIRRKRAEETAAEKTMLLSNVINASPDFIIVKDRDLRTMLCNQAVGRAIGKQPDELYGKTDIENGWPHDQVKGNASKGIRGFEADDLEALAGSIVHNPADPANVGNEVCYFDTLKVPLRDAAGAIIGMVGVARDITARKRTEEALARANSSLQIAAAVIENASEGVMVIDAQLRIRSVNPAFEQITGYAASEAVGQTPRILFSGRHNDLFFEQLHKQIDIQGHWRGEIWNRRRSGELYPQQTSLNVLRNQAGQISHYAAIFSDNTQQNELETKLRALSSVDGLTGISNRRTFDEVLEKEWARAQREHQPLSLVMADIDHFKLYNDRYGHPGGDSCLQQVARAIDAGANRASDLAARYGGEEFVVVLPSTNAAGAAVIAEKLRARVAALGLPHEASLVAPFVTISIGVATLIPSRKGNAAQLTAAADRALYEAKRSGRNRIVADDRATPVETAEAG
jgi:diguanylate cyclase (GGDEF)-like protein/PAS domain S-box-containing protein